MDTPWEMHLRLLGINQHSCLRLRLRLLVLLLRRLLVLLLLLGRRLVLPRLSRNRS